MVRKQQPKPHSSVAVGAEKNEEHMRIERLFTVGGAREESRPMPVELTIEQVSPETARNWLEARSPNRPLSKARVKRLSDAILRREWQINGDTIKFNGTGKLIDGQHRLAAIVEANCTVPVAVARNVRHEAFATFDTGMRRSLGQMLALEGEAQATSLAAAINLLFPYAEGKDLRTRTHNAPTFTQALAFLRDNPNLRESVQAAGRIQRITHSNATALASAHFILSKRDPEDAEFFFEHLHNGVGMEPGSPILVLRNRLAAGDWVRSAEDHTHDSVIQLAVIIKAWNAWREGRHIELLRWNPGGSRPEAFPTPI